MISVLMFYRVPVNDESVNGLEAALDDLQNITKNPKSSIVLSWDINVKDIQWNILSISRELNKENMCNKILNTLNESHQQQLQ